MFNSPIDPAPQFLQKLKICFLQGVVTCWSKDAMKVECSAILDIQLYICNGYTRQKETFQIIIPGAFLLSKSSDLTSLA